ncbi:MAG: DUF4160 domain-containing protein [Ignavibacteriota bacterium]
MPELSRFFGIVIRMFREEGLQHHKPHFHAEYQGQSVTYSIEPIELIAGEFPTRQKRLVEAWAELHKEELSEDWQILVQGKIAKKIQPLQ